MEKFIIEGGNPLCGEVTPAGNKNAALPIIAACLLTEEPVILRNVPLIGDVSSMRNLIESLGVEVTAEAAEAGRIALHFTVGDAARRAETTPVTTQLLGKAKIPGLPYEDRDGARILAWKMIKFVVDMVRGASYACRHATAGAFGYPWSCVPCRGPRDRTAGDL